MFERASILRRGRLGYRAAIFVLSANDVMPVAATVARPVFGPMYYETT
jgi:hypothetical protein